MLITSTSYPFQKIKEWHAVGAEDPRIIAMTKVVRAEDRLEKIHARIAELRSSIASLEADRNEAEKELTEAKKQVQDFVAASRSI
ncbi:MAG: hypothetical protein ISN29_05070 [Gammaproteobacteria bacterium AqS3]|nr:hypothetical protein [Gammaproteobacteria bacterium AqS3]